MRPALATSGFAAALGAVGAFWGYRVGLGIALAVIAVVAILAAGAHRLPVLHRLPLVGAKRPPSQDAVTFRLGGQSHMTFQMESDGPEDAILIVGVRGENRPTKINDVLWNVWVERSTRISRCAHDGSSVEGGGAVGEGPDGFYWSVEVTLPTQAFEAAFRVTIPEPGEYPVVLTMNSTEFHDRGDHWYRGKLEALPPRKT